MLMKLHVSYIIIDIDVFPSYLAYMITGYSLIY